MPESRGLTVPDASLVRPRRSVLYVPGANTRAIEKSRSLACDAIILDLEDAVAPGAKETARENVWNALHAGGFGTIETVIRINGLETPWGEEDLRMAAASRANAILLPKVERCQTVQRASEALLASHSEASLWLMIETPRGVLSCDTTAGASPRVACLVMGTSDLVKDLRARHTRERLPVLTSLGLAVLAARAHRLTALDGVHLDLDDAEGFEYSCRQALELGFDGKTLIHPKTIAAANRIFSPSAEAVAHAQRVRAAFEESISLGRGVTVVDGKLVEALHVEEANRLIALDEAISRKGGLDGT